MRPRGEYRPLLLDALSTPGMARELAGRTQISYDVTRRTLDNMCRSGEAAVLYEARVDGVRRPVPVYGRPPEPEAAAECMAALAAMVNEPVGSWADFE